MSMTEVGLMPYGLIMDFFEIYLQEHGVRKPYREVFIDEIFPD